MIPQIKPIFSPLTAQAVYDLIISGSWLTEFTYTREFEKQIAELVGVEHCWTVNNGTIGLMLALKACGVEVGDKVACPALSMIATATAITMIGAVPVFVDVDDSGCLDIYKLKDKVKAVMYVPLNGRSGGLKDVRDYCNYQKIPMVEDACQCLGGSLGTTGDIGVYSLSPHKIISTGQGGLVITNDNSLSSEIRHLRDFGRTKGGIDEHRFFGINSKFTDLQAVIGLEQLKDLDLRIEAKKRIYNRYYSHLKDIMLSHHELPWMVDIYTPKRDELAKSLTEIQTRKMYPVIPHQDCYRELKSFPIAQRFADTGLWLPSSIDLSNEEIDLICERVIEFLGKEI